MVKDVTILICSGCQQILGIKKKENDTGNGGGAECQGICIPYEKEVKWDVSKRQIVS